jgi:hypothetical protein
MTLHRTTSLGEKTFQEDMTPDRALDYVHVCMRIPLPSYVERFTSRRVIIVTPSQCMRTEITGPLFELYPLVLAMRHSKKPVPAGASSRVAGVIALGDTLSHPTAANRPVEAH